MITTLYVIGFIIMSFIVSFGYIIVSIIGEDDSTGSINLPMVFRGIVLGVGLGCAWPAVVGICAVTYVLKYHVKEVEKEIDKDCPM